MTPFRRLPRQLAAIVVACSVAACAVDEGPDGASAQAEGALAQGHADDDAADDCDVPPRVYDIYFPDADGTCRDVTASRGRWVASPLFGSAPKLASMGCSFAWEADGKGDEPPSTADRAAITHRAPKPRTTAVANCTGAPLTSAPADPPNIARPGSPGCDVCARQVGDRVFAIIPRERVIFPSFEAKLTSGVKMRFAVPVHASPALVITLPDPPAGDTWASGPLRID